MKKSTIIVVGGIAAGPSAAAKAARIAPDAEVCLLEAGDTISYGVCEIPYAVGGTIADETRLVSYTPEKLERTKRVKVYIRHRVERIDVRNHEVGVLDLGSAHRHTMPYDRLILATGAGPRKLGVEGEEARNVFRIRRRDETLRLINYLESRKPGSAVIVGGGYVGLEMAEALRAKGLNTAIVHRHSLPLRDQEDNLRIAIRDELEKNSITFHGNSSLRGMQRSADGTVIGVETDSAQLPADMVVLAAGILPSTDLAREAGIRLGGTGGISTDKRCQTDKPDIYAAGDCSEVTNLITQRPDFIPLATVASRAGRVAGENAAGGAVEFPGAVRTMAVKVFDLEVGLTGLTMAEASRAGFDPFSESITAPTKVSLMPGVEEVTVDLIADRKTGRLLGAQLFGGAGTALRTNTLSIALQQGMSVRDVARLDLLYTPPYAPLWDPVLIAASRAQDRLSSSE